jgi:hypothetical protein
MHEIDAAVLGEVERSLLTPTVLDEVLVEAEARWEAERAPAAARRVQIRGELKHLDDEIAALEQQLTSGAPWRLIDEPITLRKERRDRLRGELAQADVSEQSAAHLAGPSLRAALARRLADWGGLAARQPEEARHLFMRLLDGQRIVLRPLSRGRGCEISGTASYAGLLAECGNSVVTPAGFEPAISTLKGSRPGPG